MFAGAPVWPTPRVRARVQALLQPRRPYVVAADGGARSALAFDLLPDLVVGDFDSLDHEIVEALRGRGAEIVPFPADKDATDGDLAVERVASRSPSEVLLLGFLGGERLDQSLANVGLLLRLPWSAALVDEQNECRLLRGGEQLGWTPAPGELVSLIPFGGDAGGITTRALRWPLVNADLPLGSTRGVSNQPVTAAGPAGVSLRRGMLLVARHFPGPA